MAPAPPWLLQLWCGPCACSTSQACLQTELHLQAASSSSHSYLVPSTAGGCTGRVHTPITHPWLCLACILPVSHTPLAAPPGMAASTPAGDACLGSGTPARVEAPSCPQVPAGRVLGCPCSTGLPQPQAASSPPSVFFKRITFLLNTLIRLVAVCLQCC